MPVASRNAQEFLRRHGLLPTPRSVQPKLDTGQIRLRTNPLTPDEIDPFQLLDAGGSPPPDRGITEPWPPPMEVE